MAALWMFGLYVHHSVITHSSSLRAPVTRNRSVRFICTICYKYLFTSVTLRVYNSSFISTQTPFFKNLFLYL